MEDTGAGEECEESRTCEEVTTTPFPHLPSLIPLHLSGRGRREIWSEVKPGKEGAVGGESF